MMIEESHQHGETLEEEQRSSSLLLGFSRQLQSLELQERVSGLESFGAFLQSQSDEVLLNQALSLGFQMFTRSDYFARRRFIEILKENVQVMLCSSLKNEIINLVISVLDSFDEIGKSFSLELFIALSDFYQDRVDILHKILFVAQNSKDWPYHYKRKLYSNIRELCEKSEEMVSILLFQVFLFSL